MSILSTRPVLLGGFALILLAPAIGAIGAPASIPASPVAECPPGYVTQPTSGSCIQGGNGGGNMNAPKAIPGNPNVPEVDGVPCLGGNSGQCIGLQQSQGGG
jgi:hypothetical protein